MINEYKNDYDQRTITVISPDKLDQVHFVLFKAQHQFLDRFCTFQAATLVCLENQFADILINLVLLFQN